MRLFVLPCAGAIVVGLACAGGEESGGERTAVMDSTARIATVEGLAGPEAVRYDPSQDVYFVANFNGDAAGDANGFISRVAADGTVEVLRFMTGSPRAPLHGPRGMILFGRTLWAVDADGAHGFDPETGTHLRFVDFRHLSPGFLNDITLGPDGAFYVTDTGRSRVYRMVGNDVSVALEGDVLGQPNGITWDADSERFLVAAWGDGEAVRAWWPATDSVAVIGTAATGRFDGIELVGGRILVASQTDSSLHVIRNGTQHPLIKTPGRPADIGIDTRRNRVAVPYIALDRVDIWPIPQ